LLVPQQQETSVIQLTVNGDTRRLDVDPQMPLLWVIREHIGLTGTKYGCGIGQCGACTVHLNGAAVRSCSVPLAAAAGGTVTTIEGLVAAADPEFSAVSAIGQLVQQAWRELDVVQCGFCQSGQIMAATALLSNIPNPDDGQVDDAMKGNICRCGTYVRIRAAIKRAAAMLPQEDRG
jgi:isoquinoline 1-oxidoreductase alpha subunit